MKKILVKAIAVLSILFGVGSIGSVVYPILSYELNNSNYEYFLSPVPTSSGAAYSRSQPVDLTKASNWFEGGATPEDFVSDSIGYYTLSIPSLGIEKATAAIGGENLSEALIHYPGTALPGKRGNAVIFGHSSLPQLFSPTNYDTIFSTLPTLKIGEEIITYYDGIKYRYVIEDMFEVLPTDIQVLAQDTSDSFISLITCVPPGHPLRPRRLVVRARLVPSRLSYDL